MVDRSFRMMYAVMIVRKTQSVGLLLRDYWIMRIKSRQFICWSGLCFHRLQFYR